MTNSTGAPAGATSRPYRLISADQHINEPPDLWTSRVPAKFKDRVPRMQSFEKGDAWVIEGVKDPISFGMNACAGMRPEDMRPWMRWEEVRKGGYIPAERLKEMDIDGVDAAIMYSSPRPGWGITNNKDRELQLAMVRAYNDWLGEYVSYAPDRLFGVIWLPATGVQDAVDELKRCIEWPGMIGPVINCYPHGTARLEPEDDLLWQAIVEMDVPLSIHVRLSDVEPGIHKDKIIGGVRNADAMLRMQEMMLDGVLDRFPALKVVFAEVDAGWVPFFQEQLDNRYHRMAMAAQFGLTRPPSEYFARHFFYTFLSDAHAIKNRDAVGVEHLLWSDDFPHVGGDWPYTQRTLVQAFSGVPQNHRELMFAGNAIRLYKLPSEMRITP